MFGYITAQVGELKVREHEAYKAVYCGLCKQLKKSCGPFSRMFLSYDVTFMALLALSLQEECHSRVGRCMLNPMKKRRMVCEEPALEYSALADALLTAYKLKDDRADEKGWDRLKARVLGFLFRPVKRRAGERLPVLEEKIAKGCEQLGLAERGQGLSLDHYCDFSAQMLADVFEGIEAEEKTRRVLREVGYFTGKWIYLMDAADDLKGDFLKGRFNAIITAYPKEETETLEMYAARVEPVVKRYLEDTLAMLWRAFELLPIRSARGIVENIVYLGMPERQRTVLKKWSGGLLEERKPVSD